MASVDLVLVVVVVVAGKERLVHDAQDRASY